METCAALWYLADRAIDPTEIGEINRRLMNLLVGTRTDPDGTFPKAENVLKFVDRVDKTIPGFRTQYDRLSEFAHPNHSGTVLLFSRLDETTGIARFGKNMRSEDEVVTVGLANLASAVEIFLMSCADLDASLPEFIHLCEQNVQSGPLSDSSE
jgi:hypothetical protein